jgi:Transposase, Mutator family
MEADIDYPTDADLLEHAVRKADEAAGPHAAPADRDHDGVGGPAGREEGAGRDLQRPGQGPRPGAIKAFAQLYGAKFPKAVKKVSDDEQALLAFYDLAAEHWIHLRTTNRIESTFATVRQRTRVTRCAGSRTAALAMADKLVESAQARRAVNAPHLVALVRAGARLEAGQLVERPAEHAPPSAAQRS